MKVTEVAAGLRHSVALNGKTLLQLLLLVMVVHLINAECGAVFTWGSGKRGQLGHEQASDIATQPTRGTADV